MRIRLASAVFLSGTLAAAIGCQQDQTYQTEKPVLEDVDESFEEAGDQVQDAADAVTPDDNIVDVDSPLGDVDVGEDPVTGDTNVDVDTK